jgi:hypothetical protein
LCACDPAVERSRYWWGRHTAISGAMGPRRSLHRLGFEGSGVNGWAVVGMWGWIRGKDALWKGACCFEALLVRIEWFKR